MIRVIKVIFCSLLISLQFTVNAQHNCGTPPIDSASFYSKPWVGNNKFLDDILDSLGFGQVAVPKSASGGFDQTAEKWIPVRAWVYHDNAGTGGIAEEQVEESIRLLNEYFAGEVNNTGNAHSHTLIQFYLHCNPTYINNSNFSDNPLRWVCNPAEID